MNQKAFTHPYNPARWISEKVVSFTRFLVDTNIWPELLLEQEKADEVRKLFQNMETSTFQMEARDQ